MAEPLFKSGDQVKLKSGSPAMTVNTVSQFKETYQVNCVWFHNSKQDSILVVQEALVAYDASQDSLGIFI